MLKETDYNSIIGMLGCIAEESGNQGVSIKTIKRILQQYTNFPNEPKDGPERGRWLQQKFQKMPDKVDKAIMNIHPQNHKEVPTRERTEAKDEPHHIVIHTAPADARAVVQPTKSHEYCQQCKKRTSEYRWIHFNGLRWHVKCWEERVQPWHRSKAGGGLQTCVGCKTGEWLAVEQYYGQWWHKACWEDQPVPHKEVPREQHEVSGVQAGKLKKLKQEEYDYDSITRTASKVKTLHHCHKCKKYTEEHRWVIVDGYYWHEKCWEDCSAPYKLSMKHSHSKDSQWCNGCEESNEKGVKADSRGWWWHKECFAREGIENPVQGEATECVECGRFLMKGDSLLEKLCWMCVQQRKLGKEMEDGYKGNFAELEIACAARMNQCFQCGSSKGKLVKDERGFWWHKKCQEEYLKESKMRAHKIHDKQESSTDEKTETKNACFLCDHTGQEFGTLIEDEYQKGRWYHRECGDAYAAFLKRRQCDDCGKPSMDLDDENCCPNCRDTLAFLECIECESILNEGDDFDRKLCLPCLGALEKMHKKDEEVIRKRPINITHINADTVGTMIPSLATFPDSLEGFPHRKLIILADALDKNRPRVKKSKSTATNNARLRKWCREKLASLSAEEVDAFREDVK